MDGMTLRDYNQGLDQMERAVGVRKDVRPVKYTNVGSGSGEMLEVQVPDRPAAARPRPQEDLVSLAKEDFSRREEFEQEVFKQIGYNPFNLNPRKEIQNFDSGTGIQDYFNKVFKGTMSWYDKDRMNAHQRAHWNKALKIAHANIEQQVKTDAVAGERQYQFMMSKFDAQADAVRKAREKVTAEQARKEKYKSDMAWKMYTQAKDEEEAREKLDLKREKEALKRETDQEKRSIQIKDKLEKLTKKIDPETGMVMVKLGTSKGVANMAPTKLLPQTHDYINELRAEIGQPALIEVPVVGQEEVGFFADLFGKEGADKFTGNVKYVPADEMTEDDYVAFLGNKKDPDEFVDFLESTMSGMDDVSAKRHRQEILAKLKQLNPELHAAVMENFRKNTGK